MIEAEKENDLVKYFIGEAGTQLNKPSVCTTIAIAIVYMKTVQLCHKQTKSL